MTKRDDSLLLLFLDLLFDRNVISMVGSTSR